jgi:hypothetical protein
MDSTNLSEEEFDGLSEPESRRNRYTRFLIAFEAAPSAVSGNSCRLKKMPAAGNHYTYRMFRFWEAHDCFNAIFTASV